MSKGNYEVEVPIELRISVKCVEASNKKKAVKEAMERVKAALATLSPYMLCFNVCREKHLCTFVDGQTYDD